MKIRELLTTLIRRAPSARIPYKKRRNQLKERAQRMIPGNGYFLRHENSS
jgi:hypothetical protein